MLYFTESRRLFAYTRLTLFFYKQGVSTKFDMRDDPNVIQNYGRILIDLAATVPDGLVAFFVSYSYMEQIVSKWHETGVLQQVMQHKLVFIETQDVVETSLALDNYRKACNCGRGAVFLSVARGKRIHCTSASRFKGSSFR